MNTHQAKRLPLKDILTALGCNATKEVRGECWYLSPFRAESEPSFKINLERNIWYDFGLGAGGNVIDFAMQYFNASTVALALCSLEQLTGSTAGLSSTPPQKLRTPIVRPIEKDQTQLREVKPLQNKALIQYLRSRAIPADLASTYVQEIHYTRAEKPYFALAFPNRSNGYEIRNPYFKGTYGTKDISLVPFAEVQVSGGLSQIMVFEGFMDFLSALVNSGHNTLNMPALVLNSVSMREKAISFIKTSNIEATFLYFDHDTAGRELTAYFQQALNDKLVVDQSMIYAGHKDYNTFLMKRQQERG